MFGFVWIFFVKENGDVTNSAGATDNNKNIIKAKAKLKANWLEKVLLAVDASCPGETFVRQRSLAVGALEALGVPVSVQHLQDELVQDVLTTACTLRDLCEGKRSGHT